ncbi:MAG: beta-hydroxyacyl-ACP dehydratase [Planctomycetales bacterium]|nr:beta-hydroxyacyl-ACP dehydratase [Planctomycetales bacterium]
MRFCLLDRICGYEADKELTSVKSVSLAEEYLADHFPQFPVLPGVFMLESATQSAAWLVRLSEDFAHSIVELEEARSVKFTDFVSPGRTLRMQIEQVGREGELAKFKFQGEVDQQPCVSGRLTLRVSNLAETDARLADLDARMIQYQRAQCSLLISKS